jgi:hypothetical protein
VTGLRETPPPGEPERRTHVGVAARGRQTGLWRAVTDATQHAPDRQAQLAREIVGLIEPALDRPERMERDRDDRIRAREQIAPGLAKKAAKRRGQRATALVFEGVDDLAERAVVPAGTAREREPRGLTPAARAERTVAVKLAQRIAAADAAGRRKFRYRAPAPHAHGPGERLRQDLVTGGARRRKQHSDDDVGAGREHAADQCKGRASRNPLNQAGTRSEYADFSK